MSCRVLAFTDTMMSLLDGSLLADITYFVLYNKMEHLNLLVCYIHLSGFFFYICGFPKHLSNHNNKYINWTSSLWWWLKDAEYCGSIALSVAKKRSSRPNQTKCYRYRSRYKYNVPSTVLGWDVEMQLTLLQTVFCAKEIQMLRQ